MNLHIACVPVAGRNATHDWIWMLHDGERMIDVSQGQFWTKEAAHKEALRYVRNRQAAAQAFAGIVAKAAEEGKG